MPQVAAIVGLSLVPCACLSEEPQEWARFRGQQGAGVAAASRVPDELNERTLIWKQPAPPGKSSPALTHDRVFLTGWRNQRRLVICLDRKTGRMLWERAISHRRPQVMHSLNDPAAPSPATDGTNVYAFFADSGLVSYDRTGKERWRVPLGPFNSLHGIGTSPIVANGTVVLAIEQQAGGSWLAAFDASSGSVRWKRALAETGQQGYGTPFVAAADGVLEIVYSRPGEIGGWSLATGEPLWWVRGTGTQAYSSPAVGDGVLYAAADGDTVEGAMQAWEQFLRKWNRSRERTLRVKEDWDNDGLERADRIFGNNDGLLDENEWRLWVRNNEPKSLVAVRLGGKGNVTDSHVLWRTGRGVPTVPSPVAFGNVLFYVRDGGIFTSLDASTGSVLREARIQGATEKFFASPVIGGGNVYLASDTGKVIVIRAKGVWETISVQDLDEPVFATPAIGRDGRIYLRTASALYCFGRS